MPHARPLLERIAATALALSLGAAPAALADATAALEGRVVDAAGHPVEGVALVLRHGDDTRYAVESATEGRFLLRDVVAEPGGYVVELDDDARARWQLLSYRVEPSERDARGELSAEIVISDRVAGWAPSAVEGALVTGGVVAGIGAGVSIPVLLGDDGGSSDGAIAAAEETGRGDSDEEPPSFLPPQHPEPQQPNPDRPSPPPVFAPPPNPSPTR